MLGWARNAVGGKALLQKRLTKPAHRYIIHGVVRHKSVVVEILSGSFIYMLHCCLRGLT